MKVEPANNKDALAGLLFLLIGALAVVVARDYPIGSLARMGPGWFPTALGSILLLFGFYLMARGLRSGEKVKEEWGGKPLALVTLSMALFAFIMSRFGLVPALVAMFFVSALGGREIRFTEVLILALSMSAFAAGIFVYALKLPYPLFAGF